MANSFAVPILTLTGLSFFNTWYSSNGTNLDWKIPVAGGIAYVMADLISQIPGAEGAVTGIAWIAVAAWLIAPGNTLVSNLTKITG